MSYFILKGGDKGETRITGPISKEELIRQITPDKDGDSMIGTKPSFCTKIPDFEYGRDGYNPVVIIQGEIIVPKVVSTVTKYEL